jgi:hypothetical protein
LNCGDCRSLFLKGRLPPPREPLSGLCYRALCEDNKVSLCVSWQHLHCLTSTMMMFFPQSRNFRNYIIISTFSLVLTLIQLLLDFLLVYHILLVVSCELDISCPYICISGQLMFIFVSLKLKTKIVTLLFTP